MQIQERVGGEKLEIVDIGRLLFQGLLLKGEGRKRMSSWRESEVNSSLFF